MTYARLCIHGEVKAHAILLNGFYKTGDCPGGSVLPDDTLVIVKEEDDWPGWVRIVDLPFTIDGILDALASAQGSQE